jgi:hypothetical protein
MAVIERDYSHPCIITWVPFNESWGVPELPNSLQQRQYIQALYALTKTIDQTRPVIGNDGWEHVATDIIGIHDYVADPEQIRQRYYSPDVIGRLFARERPGGRLLTLEDHPHAGQPLMLTEFGGIAFSADTEATWGYTRSESAELFSQQYTELLNVVRELKVFSGFCYTQLTDTYQETNGLLYIDRTPKFPLEEIALATRGPRTPRQLQIEHEWQLRMLKFQQAQNIPSPYDDEGMLPPDTVASS